jgi:hypothetical protein
VSAVIARLPWTISLMRRGDTSIALAIYHPTPVVDRQPSSPILTRPRSDRLR